MPNPKSSSTCVLCIEQVAAKADFPACQVDIVQICCRYVHLLSACTHAGTGENATHACSAMSAEKETLLEFSFATKNDKTERNKYLHVIW